jgi:hypothetical protein
MIGVESHARSVPRRARSRFVVSWLSALMCVLLCSAPCSAADGRWFPNPLPREACSVEPIDSIRAPQSPLAQDAMYVVLAPGLVSQSLPRPKAPGAHQPAHIAAGPVRVAPAPALSAVPDREAPPPEGIRETERHLCLCVFLI